MWSVKSKLVGKYDFPAKSPESLTQQLIYPEG
jgi:hypothetical protein